MRKCAYYVRMLRDFNNGCDLKNGQVYGLNNKKFVDNLVSLGIAEKVNQKEFVQLVTNN
jgi:hypothetical protein